MDTSLNKDLQAGHRRRPFPLLDKIPGVLRDVILDFHWDPDRLHSLTLPERVLAVADLAWHLELPFWAAGGQPFQVSPMEVAANPDHFRDQWERTMKADLNFPLDAWIRSDDQVVLLDGVHRLLKASILGVASVRVRMISESQFDAIAH